MVNMVMSKELLFFFFFFFFYTYKLKFGPNFACRAINFDKFQISLVGVKNYYIYSKWGSKELNHAATGDLKNGGRACHEKGYLALEASLICILLFASCDVH